MNIWKYQNNYKFKIEKKFQLELEEKEIKQVVEIDIAELEKNSLDLKNLNFWSELQNPTNSFKDRSLLYQISYYYQSLAGNAKIAFAISSSGNAAIAAANICKKYGFSLDIFVSDKLNSDKLEKLNNFKSQNIIIHQSVKAKSDCMKFCETNNVINLRASSDDSAIEGYKSLGYEVFENNLNFDSIFITCSSGTATLGIYQGLKEKYDQIGKLLPQFHIIQTSSCNPIASNILNLSSIEIHKDAPESLITCVVDKVAKRKDEITKLVLETSGSAWIVDNDDLMNAKLIFSRLIKSASIDNFEISGSTEFDSKITWNSISSFAGMLRAKEKGWEFKNPLVIISGV